MSIVISDIEMKGAWIHCENAETENLTVTTAETLKEGLILGRDTSTGKLDFYARGGANGLDVARYVLLADFEVTAAHVSAGNVNVRVMQAGKVSEKKISTKAGDTINHLEIDGLKDNSIMTLNVEDVSETYA